METVCRPASGLRVKRFRNSEQSSSRGHHPCQAVVVRRAGRPNEERILPPYWATSLPLKKTKTPLLRGF